MKKISLVMMTVFALNASAGNMAPDAMDNVPSLWTNMCGYVSSAYSWCHDKADSAYTYLKTTKVWEFSSKVCTNVWNGVNTAYTTVSTQVTNHYIASGVVAGSAVALLAAYGVYRYVYGKSSAKEVKQSANDESIVKMPVESKLIAGEKDAGDYMYSQIGTSDLNF